MNDIVQLCVCGHDIDTHYKHSNGMVGACLGRGCNAGSGQWGVPEFPGESSYERPKDCSAYCSVAAMAKMKAATKVMLEKTAKWKPGDP